MSNRQAKLAVAVAAFGSLGVLALVAHNHLSPKPLPDSHSFDYVQRLIWLNNWADAAEALRGIEASGAVPSDSRSQILCSAVKLRGRIESGQLQSAADELRKLLQRPEALADKRLRLMVMSALGDVLFQYDLLGAEAVWEDVYRTADATRDSVWKSRSEGELGAIAFLNGQMRRALHLVASTAFRAETNGDIASQIKTSTALGEGLVNFGRAPDALRFFDRALRIYESNPGAYFPFTAYVGKARILGETGHVPEARFMLEQGLAEARQKGFRMRETRLLAALAALEERAGNTAQAYQHLQSAANLAAAAGMFRIQSDVTTALADNVLKSQGPVDALPFAQRSVDAAERAGDLYSMPRKLAVLAEVLAATGNTSGADANYERACRIVDQLLQTVPFAKDKSTLVGAMDRVFLGRFALIVNQRRDPAKAFEVLETARARGLIEVLRAPRHSGPKTMSPVTPALVALHLKLSAETDPASRRALIDQVWETEVRSSIAGTVQQATARRFAPVRLRELQAILRDEEILIEYVLGNPHSYALEIGHGHVRAYALASRTEIEDKVDRYVRRAKAMQDTGQLARELYSKLLDPVEGAKTAKRMIFVPDGKLHGLPFDSLIDPTGTFVVSRAVISYTPSASVNVYLARAPHVRPKDGKELLAVGAVPYGGESAIQKLKSVLRGGALFDDQAPTEFSDLPGSAKEIAQIAPLVKYGIEALTGDKATESAVKTTDLTRYRALHFAVHASIDEQFPDRSALRLAKESASQQDGLLQAREVIGLDLKAELVTLSACDAGSGRVEGLAGLNSLVQAFLMAGAHSVVASTWSAEDNSTAELMRSFYSHLRDGADKAEALTLAKRDLIAKYGSNAQPFLWAGFRLIGDPHGTLVGD